MNKELKRLKSALWKYKLCKKFPFLKWILYTNFGFCNHFNVTDYQFINSSCEHDFRVELPTLHSLKPKNGGYWFKKGKLEPRIELLEKAIKIIKEE